VRPAPPNEGDSVAKVIPGLGDGAKLAFEIIDALCRELPIDRQHISVVGQSMGGAGVWHMIVQRPRFFAAAVPCCGSPSLDDVATAAGTPVWAFHGDADQVVPVAQSRDRVATMRKAGGHPLYTEYAGVGHNAWEWAFTEPALIEWILSKRRRA
jgi:predicted peptidase